MLSRCLNPSCSAQFRYLHEGRIFKVEQVVASPADSEPQQGRTLLALWTLQLVAESGRRKWSCRHTAD